MDFGSLDQAGFLRLLRRLQGRGGYSDDDDSNRTKELNAVAKVAALASEALELAGRNEFPSQAVEALLSLERLFGLPGDVQFTDAQRQSRLRAFMRALPKMVESRLDAAFDSYLSATSGVTIRPNAVESWYHRAPPAGGLHVQRQEPSADSVERRTLDPILARGLPARALGGKVSTGDATFGSGSIDRKSINIAQAVLPSVQTKANCPVIPYYPGSVIAADDWKEIQAMLLWKGKSIVMNQSSQGRTIVAMGSITAGSTAIIDGPTHGGGGAISWDNRLVQAWGVFSSTDVRLSGSPDLSARPSTDHCWLSLSKLGTTGTPYLHEMVDIATGANVNAQISVNGTGDLTLKNNAAGTRYFAIMFRCCPTHTTGSSGDTEPLINATDIVNADITQVARSVEVRDANGGGAGWTKTSLFSGDQAAIRRICYSGPLGKGSSDGRQRVILDSSEDWRKRYVLLVPVTKADASQFQSASWGTMSARYTTSNIDCTPRLFYTGPGAAQGSATAVAYQHPDQIVNAKNVWIFADSTTGNLIAEMKSTDSASNFATVMFLALGSEMQDGASVANTVPLHATQIHALDLNQIQNNGCYAQGFQGGAPRHYIGSSTKGNIPTCPPLGLIAEGAMPRRPVSWMVRERVGDYDDADGYYEQRQPIINQRKRLISVGIAASGEVPIDDFNEINPLVDQADMRDRLIWIEGRFSANDIAIPTSPQTGDVASTTRFCAVFYSGPFGDQSFAIGNLTIKFEFSRTGSNKGQHSRITLTNNSGSDMYINMATECSGFLGLTDRRQYGVYT